MARAYCCRGGMPSFRRLALVVWCDMISYLLQVTTGCYNGRRRYLERIRCSTEMGDRPDVLFSYHHLLCCQHTKLWWPGKCMSVVRKRPLLGRSRGRGQDGFRSSVGVKQNDFNCQFRPGLELYACAIATLNRRMSWIEAQKRR